MCVLYLGGLWRRRRRPGGVDARGVWLWRGLCRLGDRRVVRAVQLGRRRRGRREARARVARGAAGGAG